MERSNCLSRVHLHSFFDGSECSFAGSHQLNELSQRLNQFPISKNQSTEAIAPVLQYLQMIQRSVR